jgi:hypothetical protein
MISAQRFDDDKLVNAILDRLSNETRGSDFVSRLLNNERFIRGLTSDEQNRELLRHRLITDMEACDDIELAEKILHCSVSNVRFLRQTNQGPPFFHVGRLVRYKKVDVLRWLDGQKTTNQPRQRPRKEICDKACTCQRCMSALDV